MIRIAELRDSDVGRSVIYTPSNANDPAEEGVIVRWNESYVFVRYGKNPGAQATSPGSLRFSHKAGNRGESID